MLGKFVFMFGDLLFLKLYVNFFWSFVFEVWNLKFLVEKLFFLWLVDCEELWLCFFREMFWGLLGMFVDCGWVFKWVILNLFIVFKNFVLIFVIVLDSMVWNGVWLVVVVVLDILIFWFFVYGCVEIFGFFFFFFYCL